MGSSRSKGKATAYRPAGAAANAARESFDELRSYCVEFDGGRIKGCRTMAMFCHRLKEELRSSDQHNELRYPSFVRADVSGIGRYINCSIEAFKGVDVYYYSVPEFIPKLDSTDIDGLEHKKMSLGQWLNEKIYTPLPAAYGKPVTREQALTAFRHQLGAHFSHQITDKYDPISSNNHQRRITTLGHGGFVRADQPRRFLRHAVECWIRMMAAELILVSTLPEWRALCQRLEPHLHDPLGDRITSPIRRTEDPYGFFVENELTVWQSRFWWNYGSGNLHYKFSLGPKRS
jgi:hypothetical protein